MTNENGDAHADGRSDFDRLRVNLERVGINGPQLDQALAEIRDSLWLAAHDEAVARRAKVEALRDEAERVSSSTSLENVQRYMFSQRLVNRAEWIEENG